MGTDVVLQFLCCCRRIRSGRGFRRKAWKKQHDSSDGRMQDDFKRPVGLIAVVIMCVLPVSGQIHYPSTPSANARCELDRDQSDDSIWPNALSSGNSDPWISQNHDRIRKMRPRVLVLNFANGLDMDGAKRYAENMVELLGESSRYHGFRDPAAPRFLEYRIIKYVDLRDRPAAPGNARRNSTLSPYFPEAVRQKEGVGAFNYGALYSKEFARYYGFPYPDHPGEFLDLAQLIQGGLIHELWFFFHHDERGAPLETAESKQYYDDKNRPMNARNGPAGNGHCRSIPWVGRSLRITFFNPDRGPGCGMENFSHAIEGMANYNCIPYFTKHFNEFAGFDLDTRYQLPARSLYGMIQLKEGSVEYPSPTSMRILSKGKTYDVARYLAAGGNVHFPPGARFHYDLQSPYTVLSTIEHYRMGDGPGGRDKAEEFNKDKFERYLKTCPDGMGPWLMFWRQSFPGLDNKCTDEQGRPMKNWWPFLFY